jgi:flagellar basal-body rod modification protein FlgD
MNALVGVRANATGLYSPNYAMRAAVEEKLQANYKADLLGKMLDGKTIKTIEEGQQRIASDTLGKEQFLELLMNQIKYQDPLEPVENTEMVAQLAQFSALEQMNNLNDSFGDLSGNVDQLNFISGGSLLGRSVTGVTVDGAPVTGVVERVELQGSVVFLTVNGQRVSMAGVTGISGYGTE